MGNKSNNSVLEKYLSQVDKHLKYMPVSEKTDILSELKSSFYERMEQGQTEHDIIAEMGPTKDFALSYLGKAIVENKNFSFRHFMMALGFYSFASLAWVSLIPVLAMLSASFFFSCGVSVLAGAMGLLKGFLHVPLIDEMQFIFFHLRNKRDSRSFGGIIIGGCVLFLRDSMLERNCRNGSPFAVNEMEIE